MVLAKLLDQGQVWRGDQTPVISKLSLLPTGFAELDQCLQGGWSSGQLIELLTEQTPSGELSVLLPLLVNLSQQPGLILWVDPPVTPYALALAQAGVRLSDHRLIQTESLDQKLWVMEQALKSGCASLVLGWLDQVPPKSLRRLQLAVQKGQGLAFVTRPIHCLEEASPARFRLKLSRVDQGVKVDLVKRAQGWPTEGPVLPLKQVG